MLYFSRLCRILSRNCCRVKVYMCGGIRWFNSAGLSGAADKLPVTMYRTGNHLSAAGTWAANQPLTNNNNNNNQSSHVPRLRHLVSRKRAASEQLNVARSCPKRARCALPSPPASYSTLQLIFHVATHLPRSLTALTRLEPATLFSSIDTDAPTVSASLTSVILKL